MQYVVCGMQYVVRMYGESWNCKRINIIVTCKGCTCRALLKVNIEATVFVPTKIDPMVSFKYRLDPRSNSR